MKQGEIVLSRHKLRQAMLNYDLKHGTKLSYRKLCEIIEDKYGVKKSTMTQMISHWINGMYEPSGLDRIEPIAKALECSVEDLVIIK